MRYELTKLVTVGEHFVAVFGDAQHPNLIAVKSQPDIDSDIEINWPRTRTGTEGVRKMATTLFVLSDVATILDHARQKGHKMDVVGTLSRYGFDLDNLEGK